MAQSILITGAGSGIGRATARAFLAAGWDVALMGRREAALRETAGDAEARILVADVADPAQVEAAFAQLAPAKKFSARVRGQDKRGEWSE